MTEQNPKAGSRGQAVTGPRVGSAAWLAMEPDAYEKEVVAAFEHCQAQDAQIWAEAEPEAGS